MRGHLEDRNDSKDSCISKARPSMGPCSPELGGAWSTLQPADGSAGGESSPGASLHLNLQGAALL